MEFDHKLNKLAGLLLIPTADILKVVGKALGFHCESCGLRSKVWRRVEELGWYEVGRITWKSLHAQATGDEEEIQRLVKSLE